VSEALVSCIVPVFNGERYLAETLDSIFEQTHRPLEVLVVDDGSTDGTAEVVARYGDRLTYLSQQNAGHAAARNRGLHTSHGTFLAFLDADDLWHPEKLERQVDRFRGRPELEYCVTHVQNFWIPELAQESRGRRFAEALPGYSTVTLLARRTLFERIGPFNPRLRHGDDTEWLLRTMDRGAIHELLPDVLGVASSPPRAATSTSGF
jgi:glycosyltransferase involved in cell wall biosynthesis